MGLTFQLISSLRMATVALLIAWPTASLLVWPAAAATPGSDPDEKHMAVSYYRQLAESGSPDAQLTMGDLYSNGDGVPQDLVVAYAWYYVAAQQGVEEAVVPMNDMLRAIPPGRWANAKRLAEDYERRFVPAQAQK